MLLRHRVGVERVLPRQIQPLHDGITQAAALLLPPDERAEIHLQLGRDLLRQPNLDDDDLFALVDHLDRGMSRMTDPAERERVGALSRDWVVRHQGDGLVEPTIEICRRALAAA